jgi:predicted DNA-binding WGR domain protein
MTSPASDACTALFPATIAMVWREYARGDRLFFFEAADRQHGGRGCWDLTKSCHDYTDYASQYGFEWGRPRSDAEFAAKPQGFFRRMEADGWAETERSLTRRVFWHTDAQPGKFWIIWLDVNAYETRSGRIPKELWRWDVNSGRLAAKAFATRERAVSAYEKLIKGKQAAGYVEVRSRARLGPALRTPDVLALARAAREVEMPDGSLDSGRLAVLADALEEAGCADDVVLSHLRQPGPHVQGCWALHTALGKE